VTVTEKPVLDSKPIKAAEAFGGKAPMGATFGSNGTLVWKKVKVDLNVVFTILKNVDMDGWKIEAFELETAQDWTAAFSPEGTKDSIGVRFNQKDASGNIKAFIKKGGEVRDFVIQFSRDSGESGGGSGCNAGLIYAAVGFFAIFLLVWKRNKELK
jgi:hypothetical protein